MREPRRLKDGIRRGLNRKGLVDRRAGGEPRGELEGERVRLASLASRSSRALPLSGFDRRGLRESRGSERERGGNERSDRGGTVRCVRS